MAIKLNKILVWIIFLSILLFFPSKTIFGLFSVVEVTLVIGIITILFKKIKIEIPNYHILLFTGVLVFGSLSFIVNKSHIDDVSYLVRLFEYLLFMIILYRITSSKILVTIKYALLTSIWLILFWSVLQIAIPETINYFSWGPVWKSSYVESNFIRVFSLLDNPLNLLGYLAIILGVIQVIEMKYRYIYILILYFLIILTASKMGFIIILLSLVVQLVIYLQSHKGKSRLIGIVVFIFSVIMLVTVIKSSNSILYRRVVSDGYLSESVSNNNITKKSEKIFNINSSDTNKIIEEKSTRNKFSKLREFVLRSSVKMLGDNWFWGIGAGNFDKVYNSGYKFLDASSEESSFTAENYFLDFYLDNGLIPLILILFLFASIIACAYRSKQISIDSLWKRGIALSLIYFIVVGLVTNLRVAPVNMLMYSLIGVFIKLNSLDNRHSD